MADAQQGLRANQIVVPPRPQAVPADKIPPQPQSPPTDEDVAASLSYLQLLQHMKDYNRVNATDIANGNKYYAQVTAAHAGIAGGGNDTEQILRELRNLSRELRDLTQKVDRNGEKIDRLGEQMRIVEQTSTVTYNRGCRDGIPTAFKVVPFNDGRDPTGPPHDLPVLSNIQDIENLTADQLRAYFKGYHPRANLRNFSVAERKTALKAAIGFLQ